jgi:hypothetical protein
LGGVVSTVTSAARNAERMAARTEVLPVPMPPDTRTLTGSVGAANSDATVSRAAGGMSVRGSDAGLAMAHGVVVTGDKAAAVVVVIGGCVVVG